MTTANKFVTIDLLRKRSYQWLILFIVIMLLYLKTISYDYNLDDYIITDALNGKVNSLKDLLYLFKLSYNQADYRPIVFVSFGIEHLLFGNYIPAVSHAVNCFLYFLICIASLKLFSLLFDKENNLLLFFAVLLFCVHPINTEVVASIKCRDNLLSMLFGLSSSIFFMKFLLEEKKIQYFIIAIALSFIAVLSKLDALGFLLFNIAYILFYKKNRKVIYIIIFYLTTLFIYFIYNLLIEKNFGNHSTTSLKGVVSITENPLALVFTLPNRIIATVNTLCYYFTKFIYISPSKYYYGYNYYNVLSTKTVYFFGGILIVISLSATFIYGFVKQKKILIISIIGIVTTGLYAFNFITPVAGIIADRYIFMANLFFCLLVSYALFSITSFEPIKKYSKFIITALFLISSTVSFVRINAWKNFRTLIDTDAPKLYNSYEAMRIAASEYYDEYKISQQTTDLDQAIFYAKKGNAVYPKNVILHLLSGQYFFKKLDYGHAVENFKIAFKNDSTLSEPLIFIGDVYYASKNSDSALYYYHKALIKEPKNPELINNISTVYFEKDKDKCLQFNYDLIKSDSTTYAAYENLGYFYLADKDTIKAKSYFRQGEKFGLAPVNINDLK